MIQVSLLLGLLRRRLLLDAHPGSVRPSFDPTKSIECSEKR